MRNAGKLNNNTIELYMPNITRNDYGEQVLTYNKVFTTKADVKFENGAELVSNSNVIHSYVVTFTIRDYVPVYENYRIKWQGNYYYIEYIVSNRAYMEKQIKCTKIIE